MADIYVGSRKRKSNRAAAALATLALLAGSIVASAAPADAAPPRPGINMPAQPTATPCPTSCAGGVNHR